MEPKHQDDRTSRLGPGLQMAFDRAHQFLGLLAPDGTLLDANPSSLALIGRTLEEVRGRLFWETPWWSHAPEVQDQLRDAITMAARGETVRFEATHPGVDGLTHSVDFSITPIVDERGQVSHLVPEGRDITEQRRAERLSGIQGDLTEALGATSDLDRALHLILEAGLRIDEIQCGAVFLAAPDEDGLRLVAHAGLSQEVVESLRLVPRDDPALLRVQWEGPLHARYEDVRALLALPDQEPALRAVALIPMRHEGRILALMGVASLTGDVLPHDTRRAIETMAAHLGAIIARIRAEESSRASEASLQAVFDNMQELVLVVDAAGRIIRANPATQALLGAEGRHLLDVQLVDVLAGGAPRTVHALDRLLSGSQRACTVAVQTGSGGTAMLELTSSSLLWHGRPASIITGRDITARISENAILEDAQRLFVQGPVVVFRWNALYGRPIEFVSPNVHEKTGYSPEALLDGKVTYQSIIHPDDLQEVLREAATRIDARDPWFEQEYRIVRADGEVRWVHDYTHAVKPEHGTGYRSYVLDVTDRRLAEEERQRAAETLETITARATGRALLQTLCHRVAARFRFRLVFIAELDDSSETLRTTAVSMGGRDVPDFEFAIRGTPWEVVLQVGWYCEEREAGLPGVEGWTCTDPVLCCGFRMTDSAGRPLGLLGMMEGAAPAVDDGRLRDQVRAYAARAASEIERHRAEEALRRSEERFAVAFQHSPVAIGVHSLETGAFLEVNETLEALTGYTRVELLGGLPRELGLWACDGITSAGARGDPARNTELQFRNRAGIQRTVSLSAVKIDFGGRPAMLTACLDITELKLAEAAVRRAKEDWEQTFNNVPDLICVLDTGLRIRRINRAMSERLGVAPGAVSGALCCDALHGGKLPLECCPHFTGGPGSATSSRHVDGADGAFIVSASPLRDEAGDVVGSVHVMRDVTSLRDAEREHTRLEAMLHQAQKMEALGRLAGGIAHDFNNMLSVILGTSELLKPRLGAGHPAQEGIAAIEEAAGRSRDMVRQLLTFSRREVVRPVTIDLNRAIASLHGTLRRLVGEHIDFQLQLAEGLWRACCEPSHVDQIIINLVANGRDSMPQGGALTIFTDNVTLSAAVRNACLPFSPGAFAMIAVQDTGDGIDPSMISCIFDPFFTTKREGKGVGLGLATVHGIVERYGGTIVVETERGRGTTFRIYLPRSLRSDEQPATASQRPGLVGSRRTILLVEDEQLVRGMTTWMLSSLGYAVVAAADGESALRQCEAHQGPIDLLLTDVVMPGMSGQELSRIVMQKMPGIRVLFMSGYSGGVTARWGIDGEGPHLIQKPFSSAELGARITETLAADPPRVGCESPEGRHEPPASSRSRGAD